MTVNSENEFTLDDVIQQLKIGTSMPAELLEIFSEEADDHLRTIYDGLSRLECDKDDRDALAEVRRASHTLKGAAGAVNMQSATRLAHRMEDLLDQLADRQTPVNELQLKLLLATADQLQGLTTGDFELESVATQIVDLYNSYSTEMEQIGCSESGTTNTSDIVSSSFSAPIGEHQIVIEHGETQNKTAAPASVSGEPTQYLRVPTDRLNDLVSLLGEMMVNRSEFQHHLDDFESRIDEMQVAMERLRDVGHAVEANQQTKIPPNPGTLIQNGSRLVCSSTPYPHIGESGFQPEFDVLEFEQFTEANLLTQTLSEAENDAEIMTDEFRKMKSNFASLLSRQQQLNSEAQKSLMRIRLVPLSGIVSRLERTVRTVSNKLGREVKLEFEGGSIELDKTVLDEITDPLLHLIRNAIDHGIEDSETRTKAGKPDTARICIRAINHGTQVTLQISDDGAGINLAKVRAKAIQQELIHEDQELANDELHALIFRPGFSTAAQLTDVSGRGVGMDVVGETIRRLKGSICVDSESGVGTKFSIQLPTTIGVARALIVETGGKSFAIPMESIKKVQNFDPATVCDSLDQPTTKLGNHNLRLIELATHLKLVPEKVAPFGRIAPMLILGNGSDEIAVVVDGIQGSQDIVVKNLGDHLKNIPGIVGATITGDGSVIPILDAIELFDINQSNMLASGEQQYERTLPVRRNLAMVVDDSISVRRVTSSLLNSAGWEVVTAKDGVEALEKLAELETIPDVFLCDMEMPRMDGLELIRQIREQREFEFTPIVMVTSRASEKHRNKAYDAGATDYVVKPFNGEQLLELISSHVQSAHETVA